MQTKMVPGSGVVEGFVQHVLPTGFMTIRHYGWMSGNSKISFTEVKWLVWIVLGWTFWLGSGCAPQAEKLTTPMKWWGDACDRSDVSVTECPGHPRRTRPSVFRRA